MTGNDIVTMIGENACAATHAATALVAQPYECRPAEYFDTGAALMTLISLFMMVALIEKRRRNNKPDGYR